MKLFLGETMVIYAVCKIAQDYFEEETLLELKKLLPEYANGELAAVCSWPDDIKRLPQWRWTSGLHFADTPDYKCNYDCSSECSVFDHVDASKRLLFPLSATLPVVEKRIAQGGIRLAATLNRIFSVKKKLSRA
ncbi:unnamed protein product [Cochlearia groenlandica]